MLWQIENCIENEVKCRAAEINFVREKNEREHIDGRYWARGSTSSNLSSVYFSSFVRFIKSGQLREERYTANSVWQLVVEEYCIGSKYHKTASQWYSWVMRNNVIMSCKTQWAFGTDFIIQIHDSPKRTTAVAWLGNDLVYLFLRKTFIF